MLLYEKLAPWWQLLSDPGEYREEAEFYLNALVEACQIRPRTLLELGSGGGNNASHMKKHIDVTLVDISREMLDVSRSLNPECEHHLGDMRYARLNRLFDCVFVHDAVCYMLSENDLSLALKTAYVHCARGGAVLFAPDHVVETFVPSTSHGGHDGKDRGLRYLQWTSDPDPSDSTYTVDYAFLLRMPDGEVLVEHDRHIEGVFSRDRWLQLMTQTGFHGEEVPFAHSEFKEPISIFIGQKSADD